MEYLTNPVVKQLLILKQLVCYFWGCERSSFALTYQKYIILICTYCCEPLVTMIETLLQNLKILQNQALRVFTGSVKTTPIVSILLLTVEPLGVVFKEKTILLYKKLMLTNFWSD